jgi:L-ascorbate metabolism protein UlaG (beta-lactamase superfamily)
MKKWAARIGVVFLLVIVVLVAAAFWSDSDTAVLTRHVSNESATTLKANWKGTPVDQRGRFMNDEFPFLPKTRDLLRWQLSENPFEAEKEADTFRLKVLDPSGFFASDADGIMWLGHASFYIRLNGKGILIDPIFGTPPFVTRYTEVPSPLEQIQRVDYVLLTHDHRDHTDETTLRSIAEKFPQAKFLAGLGSEELLSGWITPSNPTTTTGWFQEFPISDADVRVYFLPVRHWSRRGLTDTNIRLWGGYVIESGETTIYHGGDSGYGRHYRETGEIFPEIDYALIGIGAYEPRWFMEANHNNPADVIKAVTDMGARTLVPMHYATFDLSDEPPSAPLSTLNAEAEKAGLTDRVRALNIYESISIP